MFVINKEYKIANHNTPIDSKFRKDQLCLFWPLLDETDFSNPYIDVDQLKSKNKIVDLKPGHHIFIWPGTLSLFCNSQRHAIYDGNNKVVTLTSNINNNNNNNNNNNQNSNNQNSNNNNGDEYYSIQTMSLQKFKQDEPFISLCEYGIKEQDAFFRRSYTYNNRQSDHPFKVLLRSHLLQNLKEPLKISKNKYEVDILPKICKAGFFFDARTRKVHSFIDKVVAAFNDTFFVSLGQ